MDNRETSSLLTPNASPLTEIGNEVSSFRTETGKLFELDPKLELGQYGLEARTGPIHYKEAYKDTDPWLDLDESYCEPGELKGIGRVLVYPHLPNIVTVFQDICGYQIQSRSNPDHVARVELVSIDGQPVTIWQDSAALKTSVRVHPYRVGIWKDFSAASKPRATTMRWRVTELGTSDRDSHPFAFREVPEAFSTADIDLLEDRETAKVAIETARTRIDDQSWYWDELIPAEAKLVDTDWQVNAGANDGYGTYNGFSADGNYIYMGNNNGWRVGIFRFESITIPKSATIQSAYVTHCCNLNGTTAECYLRLYFEKSANPAMPNSYNDYTSRTKTSAYTDWTPGNWSSGSWYQTPSLINPLQEVVNQAEFASGNAVLFFDWHNNSTYNHYRRCSSYEQNSAAATILSATWSTGGRGKAIFAPNISWLSKSLLKRREI